MTISPFLRALAAGAFLSCSAAPMSNAAVNPPALASPASDVAGQPRR